LAHRLFLIASGKDEDVFVIVQVGVAVGAFADFFVFFFFCGFGVNTVTAHYLSADEFEMAFGFNLTAVGTGGFWGDDGGNEFFVVFAFSFGEDCFDLGGGHTRILTCGRLLLIGAGSLVVS